MMAQETRMILEAARKEEGREIEIRETEEGRVIMQRNRKGV
jgi:hypothetical protein